MLLRLGKRTIPCVLLSCTASISSGCPLLVLEVWNGPYSTVIHAHVDCLLVLSKSENFAMNGCLAILLAGEHQFTNVRLLLRNYCTLQFSIN
jgi:hypothetical protein